jgi:hypothetical protein
LEFVVGNKWDRAVWEIEFSSAAYRESEHLNIHASNGGAQDYDSRPPFLPFCLNLDKYKRFSYLIPNIAPFDGKPYIITALK